MPRPNAAGIAQMLYILRIDFSDLSFCLKPHESSPVRRPLHFDTVEELLLYVRTRNIKNLSFQQEEDSDSYTLYLYRS
jgi:hypothetical protein